MNLRSARLALLWASAVLLVAGCASYKVTTPLEKPLDTAAGWRIGEIRDALPPDMDPEDKPESGDISLLVGHLKSQLEKKKLFQSEGLPIADQLEVTGSILEYKKGSGFVRAVIGFGLGDAVLTVELQLRNATTGEVLFSGNFKGRVSDWTETGDKCFEMVAKDFAKELDKQQKKILKGT
jgi:hypothetical protein